MKIIFKVFILFLIVAVAIYAKQMGFFETGLKLMRNLGLWAIPAFLAAYVLSCLLFFPSVVLTYSSGTLFPLPLAILLSLIGTSLGAMLALLIGRYGFRNWAEKMAARNPQFKKLDEAIRQEGWKIVVLARLTPVFPFSVGNYLFGVTSIPAWRYALAAFLGTIPSAFVYTLLGHLSMRGAQDQGRSSLEWALLGVGVAATIFLAVYLKNSFQRIFKSQKPK